MAKKRKVSDDFTKPGFIDASDISKAARSQIDLNSPIAKRISEEASAAIAEIEDIFSSRHPDPLVDWVKSTGMGPEALSAKIKAMRAGEFLQIQGAYYVKTVTNEFQLAEAYVHRLEKLALAALKDKREAQEFNTQLRTKIELLEEDNLERFDQPFLFRLKTSINLILGKEAF